MAVISLLGVLILLVMVHEIGHFVTARMAGVRVDEFGLFFPPRLFSFKRGDTRYSINLLPIGGFVKLAGEEDPKVPGSLASKSHLVRVIVLASGSIMNAILPIILFSIAFMVPHQVVIGKVIVNEVAAGSPAALAGLMPGDTVLTIEGEDIRNIAELHREIHLKLGQNVNLTVERNGARETVQALARWQPPEGQGPLGIVIGMAEAAPVSESLPFWEAIPRGVENSIETYFLFKNGIISMFVGTAPATVTGPVGIAQITGEAARAGWSYLLEFAAFFSINLALINILPLPALDGGRIAFVVLEWFRRGKRISPKTEALVHTIGFVLLIGLMLAVTFQDILRITGGESVIP